MKKLLLSLLFMALPLLVSAYDVTVNGLYYNLDADAKTAEVTNGDSKQVGSVSIPESIIVGLTTYTVTSIGDEAFDMCTKLNAVTIPNTVTRIGKSAFYQCLEMTSINIPSSIVDIDEGAFRYCWELRTIDLPNSITKINDGVFSDCHKLETITIPSTITSVGICAFSNCSKLTAIILPNGITSIGSGAFSGCSSLTTLYLPESIVSVGNDAFNSTLWYNQQPDGLLYVGKVAYKYKGTMADDTAIELKEGTTEISGGAFNNCKGLISIHIPESVQNIGLGAFSGCEGLISIHIPESVQNIGVQAFDNCTKLSDVNLPSSITEIENNTFFNCKNLTSITLPEGLVRIGMAAFSNSGLTSISLPEKLKTIEDEAFRSCNSLESILIPSSVDSIGFMAFGYDNSLKSISVATGNSVYDSRNNCNAIIKTATNTLFVGCQNSFIPDGVEKIGQRAFSYCEELISIIIPASVKSIDRFAFNECIKLESVTFNEGLETIGESVFYNCSALTSITLPSTLYSIRGAAFANTNLESINSLIEEPFEISANVFYSLYSKATLYVPEGTKEKYQNKEAWKRFTNIVEISKHCAKPTISYKNGKLYFESETEGANFITSISDSDIKQHIGKNIELTVAYTISVVATASGYKNSEAAMATLCWIDAEPQSEGITQDVAIVSASAVLIQSNNGILNIMGVPNDTIINVFDLSGKTVGSAKATMGTTYINTTLCSGEVGIVNIGDKSVKILIK